MLGTGLRAGQSQGQCEFLQVHIGLGGLHILIVNTKFCNDTRKSVVMTIEHFLVLNTRCL